MRLVLKQIFPLGRFHATPWRVNPFDDPHGEWPPSPWRLVRGVAARWYQWWREDPQGADGRLDPLIKALCTSSYAFHLPVHTQRGAPVRQYFPVEFGWNPEEKKKAAVRSYGTSLAQDNFVCLPTDEDGAVWWFLQSELWDKELAEALNECLKRMTYFGRAEAFTRIAIQKDHAETPKINCSLVKRRIAVAVPVLVPEATATREDVERVTDDAKAADRSIPLGTRLLYAVRPANPPMREVAAPRRTYRETNLIQFAIGWNVRPETRSVVRLTAKFRAAVLKEMLRTLTGVSRMTWSKAPLEVREAVSEMAGKDPQGKPLKGHRHAEYLVWCEGGKPVRLMVWRCGRSFDENEQAAVFRAAGRPFSWAAGAGRADEWGLRLLPLDANAPSPPGFDGTPSARWEWVTPYVPPRHHLRRGHRRRRESLESQIRRELALRGVSGAEQVLVREGGPSRWVAVHLPPLHKRGCVGSRCGYEVFLDFPQPVRGPIRLGHSATLGLGLFRPVPC